MLRRSVKFYIGAAIKNQRYVGRSMLRQIGETWIDSESRKLHGGVLCYREQLINEQRREEPRDTSVKPRSREKIRTRPRNPHATPDVSSRRLVLSSRR